MDRRTFDGGIAALVSPELERQGFLVAFTERTGGVSDRPFDTLNLGFRTGDAAERIRSNRRRVVAALGIPPFAAARQVHGVQTAEVDTDLRGAGFDSPDSAVGEADVLFTRHREVPLAALVADCVPLVLASPDERLLVTVHAGWRGLAAGVFQRALASFDGRPAAVVGPAIGPCHYEVGEDVAAAVAAGLPPGAAVVERHGRRTALDLPGSVARALAAEGIRTIELAEVCTACHPERFFSHRRDGTTGRQAMVAVRR